MLHKADRYSAASARPREDKSAFVLTVGREHVKQAALEKHFPGVSLM